MTFTADLLSALVKVMTAVAWSELKSTLSISPPPERRLFSKKFEIASLVVVAASPVTSMVRNSCASLSLHGSTAVLRGVTVSVAPSRVCSLCPKTLFTAWKVPKVYHYKTEIFDMLSSNT